MIFAGFSGRGRAWFAIVAHAFLALLLAASVASANEDALTVVSANGEHTFKIEIADTDQSRSRGLMFRNELAPNAGMLFDFQDERPVSFWMRNTLIPLDMIFIRADGEIVNIHENAVPHDETPIPSGAPVRFVLEIPGGRAGALGIESGDFIRHPRIVSMH